MSREAVIVSVARTPIGQAFKGNLNDLKLPTLATHALSDAITSAGVVPAKLLQPRPYHAPDSPRPRQSSTWMGARSLSAIPIG